MKRDKAPHISAVDTFGRRTLIRAGRDYDGTNVTVKLDDGKISGKGTLQQGEAHVVLNGPIPDSYSLTVTHGNVPKKTAPAASPPVVIPVPSPDQTEQALTSAANE